MANEDIDEQRPQHRCPYQPERPHPLIYCASFRRFLHSTLRQCIHVLVGLLSAACIVVCFIFPLLTQLSPSSNKKASRAGGGLADGLCMLSPCLLNKASKSASRVAKTLHCSGRWAGIHAETIRKPLT